jgi:galactoside O-acetyltransferase
MQRITAAIIEEFDNWIQAIFRHIPGRVGTKMRSFFWRKSFKTCGSELSIGTGFVCREPRNISLGDNVVLGPQTCLFALGGGTITIRNRFTINRHVIIDASQNGSVVIGDDVFIAPNVVIRSSNHEYKSLDVPMRNQGHKGGKIVIGNDVWLAANSVILPDVVIGDGSIIGAGSVVTHDIPPYSIAGGVPAKIICSRYGK